MKGALSIVVCLLIVAQSVRSQPAPTCLAANEEYSDCGNLCEDSCGNNCEAPVFLLFASMTAKNPECKPGCYCASGYIRNASGSCVPNKPGVCGKTLI
jgi:Trypsin Inhibitor like cysteine rich domain